ncbi:Response regulator of zinc sigma-54-dependent two-component system [Labilithrix luteola]|uniref:Response regulator of zinc sigma-54-dependent two-component system n=1 Tax=Labilithrix luteola TaxID=1391654 RepID=A0A0K1PJN3_9BACT|nr:FHA domain-containing protein [Labilithrix luteola]AKU93748.1 Response regulator of zinc sigma-54-dependent two-component system [Labilithrix luteola]
MNASTRMEAFDSTAHDSTADERADRDGPPESTVTRAADPSLDEQTFVSGRKDVLASAFRLRLEVDGHEDSFVIVGEGSSPVVAGTGASCELRLADSAASQRHVQFEVANGQLRVRDLGSTAGTSVNGVRVVEALLDGTETVRVGSTTIQIARADGIPHAPSLTTSRPDFIDHAIAENASMSVTREKILTEFEHRYIRYLDKTHVNERARVSASGVTDRYLRLLRNRARAAASN